MVTIQTPLPVLIASFRTSETALGVAQTSFDAADASYETAMIELLDYMVYNGVPSLIINSYVYYIVGTRLQRVLIGGAPTPSP